MRPFKDDRGRSYCDLFPLDRGGDINLSILYPGALKAFHRHAKQDDWWFVARGHVRAVLVKDEPVYELWTNGWSGASGVPPTNLYQLSDTGTYVPYLRWTYTNNSNGGAGGSVTITSGFTGPLYRRTNEPEVSVYYLSEGDASLYIPAGIWHGVQNIGAEEAILLYWITNKYNEEEPDEERAPWNRFYQWEPTKK